MEIENFEVLRSVCRYQVIFMRHNYFKKNVEFAVRKEAPLRSGLPAILIIMLNVCHNCTDVPVDKRWQPI